MVGGVLIYTTDNTIKGQRLVSSQGQTGVGPDTVVDDKRDMDYRRGEVQGYLRQGRRGRGGERGVGLAGGSYLDTWNKNYASLSFE